MCPGSPDRGRNAFVEGPSGVTGRWVFCVRLSLIFSQTFPVTFLLKRWVQMIPNKGSSPNSLQGQWTFEPLSAIHTRGPLRNPALPKMNNQCFIFPHLFCNFRFFGLGDFSENVIKNKEEMQKMLERNTNMRETRQTQARVPACTVLKQKLPGRTVKRFNLCRFWPPPVISWVFLHHLAAEMCWRDTYGPLGAVSRALLLN